MFALARGKTVTGMALNNPVLETEGHVTCIDSLLASSVLASRPRTEQLLRLWWSDPLAGIVIVFYGLKEARTIFGDLNSDGHA